MPGDVEFLGASEDDAPRPAPTRVRRWWVLAVAALLLGAIAVVITRPAGREPRASAPPSMNPSADPSAPSHATLGAIPDHALATPAADASTSRCGGAPLCSVSLIVPKPLDDTLRLHLRGVHGVRVETALAQSLSTGGLYLADRVIYIRDARYLMKITVHRLAGAVPAPEAVALGVQRVRLLTGGFVVDVASYPSDRATLSRAVLRALAGDSGLEAV